LVIKLNNLDKEKTIQTEELRNKLMELEGAFAEKCKKYEA
jgi:hypothetical protein